MPRRGNDRDARIAGFLDRAIQGGRRALMTMAS